MTGLSEGVGTSVDYATVGYSAATGQRLWVARYDGAPSGADRAYSIATSPDGSEVLVTGTSRGNTGYFATLAYSA